MHRFTSVTTDTGTEHAPL